MKITEVTTTVLRHPHGRPNPGRDDPSTATRRERAVGLFVHIQTDEGIEGLGVGIANGGVRAIVEQNLASVLIGEDPLSHREALGRMFWRVRGFGRKGVAFCAISAIDIALWDLKAKIFGVPLYRLLGPYTDTRADLRLGRLDLVQRSRAGARTDRLRRTRHPARQDEGGQGLRQVRGARMCGGWRRCARRSATTSRSTSTPTTATTPSKPSAWRAHLADYDVGWFEEPVLADDIAGLAAIARAIDIPVATGEHEYTKYGFKELIAQGGADIVQPDVGRVGGVTEWMKVAHLAHAFNLPVAPHAVQLVHLHLACCTPNLKVVEYLGVSEGGRPGLVHRVSRTAGRHVVALSRTGRDWGWS